MRKRTYLKLASYQNEETEKHIAEVRSIHAEMRGYKHDFHHHLETLKVDPELGFARDLPRKGGGIWNIRISR